MRDMMKQSNSSDDYGTFLKPVLHMPGAGALAQGQDWAAAPTRRSPLVPPGSGPPTDPEDEVILQTLVRTRLIHIYATVSQPRKPA